MDSIYSGLLLAPRMWHTLSCLGPLFLCLECSSLRAGWHVFKKCWVHWLPIVFNSAHLLLWVGSTLILSMPAHLTSLQYLEWRQVYSSFCLRSVPYLTVQQRSVPRWRTQVLETECFSSHSLTPLLTLQSWTSHLTFQSLNLLICTKEHHQGLPRWSSA